MSTFDLIEALERAFPLSRQVNIEGFDHSLWVWKIDLPDLLKLVAMSRETTEDQLAMGLEACVLGVGDYQGNRVFASDRGRAWLSKNPMIVLTLAKAVQDFNELAGPSDDRKKKSENQTGSNASSSSVEISDTGTPGTL
jgi:hypothetical protein